jgi:hypothetical protein
MARFEKGQSGNPKGRPKGSRNQMTTLLKDKLDKDLDRLIDVARDKALAGDMRALKLLFERILPTPKDEPIQISEALPPLTSAQDAVAYMAVILRSVSLGEITPSQANNLAQVVDLFLRAHQAVDLETRIERLEECEGFIKENLPKKPKNGFPL